VLIQALQGIIQVLWQISTIIQDMHIWIPKDIQVTIIKHIFRKVNMVIDKLAKFNLDTLSLICSSLISISHLIFCKY